MSVTLIKGGWVVAHNGKEHKILRDGVVVFENDRITYVGPAYSGEVDHTVNAEGNLIVPGFVNMHLHAGHAAEGRVITDHGRPEFFGAGYLNYSTPAKNDADNSQDHRHDPDLAAEITLADLARFGTTTMVEIGASKDVQQSIVARAKDVGLRCYLGIGYRTAENFTNARGVMEYDWDEERGLKNLHAAVSFIEENDGKYNDRIKGTLMPMQVDTCSEKLLKRTVEISEEMGVPRQIHTAQNLLEFHETLRRYGMTPVQFLHRCGFLGHRASLGHTVFTSQHDWTHFRGDDIQLIIDSNTSTTHSPLAMMRRGMMLMSFSRYYERGINVCLGTDTYPRDIISEMRLAALQSKLADGDVSSGSAREVFNAATVNGAAALGRDDIGRISAGAKADIVIIQPDLLRWGPIYDPVKSLIDCGTGDDVRHVFVDGRPVVSNGSVVGVDTKELITAAQKEANDWYANFSKQDWQQRSIEEAFPRAFDFAAEDEFTAR